MRNIIKISTFLIVVVLTITNTSCTQNKEELMAIIVTGQNNHNWPRSNIFLKSILEKSGIFVVDTKISPSQGKDMSSFIIDFKPYNVVVLDYNGDEWPEQTKTNFVDYVKNGGGVVVYHAADNAFPDWPEYNEIIGLGGWGGRNETSGPYVYIVDGKVIRDDSPGNGGSHGAQHEFLVEAFEPSHPILTGLPAKWLHTQDELYSELRGPAKNMKILAYAHADKKFNGTGRNEPVLMTVAYEKGRVFHTVMGHVGEIFAPAMECAGFVTTLQRGAEWAATGKVTQKVPDNFPTENQSLTWEFFEDIGYDLTSVVIRLKNYEIGKSYDSFNILKKLLTENIENPERLNHYQTIILNLLKSNATSIECKRILCKEFSWVANDSYLSVFEELKNNPGLIDEAQYAIDQMEK